MGTFIDNPGDNPQGTLNKLQATLGTKNEVARDEREALIKSVVAFLESNPYLNEHSRGELDDNRDRTIEAAATKIEVPFDDLKILLEYQGNADLNNLRDDLDLPELANQIGIGAHMAEIKKLFESHPYHQFDQAAQALRKAAGHSSVAREIILEAVDRFKKADDLNSDLTKYLATSLHEYYPDKKPPFIPADGFGAMSELYAVGNYQLALKVADNVEPSVENDHEYWFMRARIWEKLGNLRFALTHYEKAYSFLEDNGVLPDLAKEIYANDDENALKKLLMMKERCVIGMKRVKKAMQT